MIYPIKQMGKLSPREFSDSLRSPYMGTNPAVLPCQADGWAIPAPQGAMLASSCHGATRGPNEHNGSSSGPSPAVGRIHQDTYRTSVTQGSAPGRGLTKLMATNACLVLSRDQLCLGGPPYPFTLTMLQGGRHHCYLQISIFRRGDCGPEHRARPRLRGTGTCTQGACSDRWLAPSLSLS